MLMLILISFILTGITAFYNFKSQNEHYHEERFVRKEKAIQESMKYFLDQQGGYINPDSVTVVFSEKICELSDVHNLSITLFDLRGNQLISANSATDTISSAPSQIDYTIFKQLSTGNTRAVIEKSFKKKASIFAYWYFNDEEGKPIAITNVRYDKKEVNKEELQSFLSNLTYIYIALFFAASILAYFLSNYITKSLQRITAMLKKVQLSEKNEPLLWESDDEIGSLVKEYNRMLQEVELSAELLAKSERESAWREMAKQVAHEIKNPLTPMKLRIQLLKKAWEEKDPNLDDKILSTTNSLVEQIDTLTKIADEFSNFAKMPKANSTELNLESVLKASLDLYKETKNITITYRSILNLDPMVMADKDQVLRVFNNLLTNAIQAIPKGKDGEIDVVLKDYNEMLIVEIKDNGIGIPDDKKDKIFVPNFTTKSTGMGLGLAMVKDIMNSLDGDLWFKSKVGEGSQFFAAFQRVKK